MGLAPFGFWISKPALGPLRRYRHPTSIS